MPDSFFTSIEPVDDFEALALPTSYRRLPDDWWIAVADVVGSTDAMAAGQYKAVNTVGVSVIAAVRNAVRPVDVPYVFGGDGAILCVPDGSAPSVRDALAGTVATASGGFGLTLRAGLVPVAWVREQGLDVLVARHRVSAHYVQCALFGGGVEGIEDALKRGRLPDGFAIEGDPARAADFTGLECRWSEIPSPAAETVALIVQALGERTGALATYRHVLERVRLVYGDSDRCRPVVEAGLRVTLSGRALSNETRLKSWHQTSWRRLKAEIGVRLAVMLGWVLFATGWRAENIDWGVYKRDLVANTDFRKFDGSVRLVLAGTPEQRTRLVRFLDGLRREGAIAYGMHVARSALMTCLIDERQSAHVHFVDAAGGGYAAAAADLKRSAT